ncbi:superoxide dismutase, Cu-Zn family [Ekhidna lutea]|uniref:Superoxide dismutase, Cu-Zn family n=1 Tax=Ekhidna lutea TaxID=447679 RepID=A0A239IZ06_EKHLU|nr:superoxide dismutase family protein [Ekhidna lutea]SNS98438.1 superoxide dismutase, Cu-Zn family [Ekhidna lutea]
MRLLSVFALILSVLSCKDEKDPGPKTFAAADIYWVSTEDGETYTKGDWMGNAAFTYQDGVTILEVSVSNMEPNTAHAMHLHQGTLEEPGRHWNKGRFIAFCDSVSMGRLWLKPFAGDIGNIQVDEEGSGNFTIQTDLWSLGTGDASDISGTVLFIHHKSEDFTNECDPGHSHDPSGHANAKIAGGTVVLGSQLLR